MLLITRKESIKLNRQKKKREVGSFFVCFLFVVVVVVLLFVCVCVVVFCVCVCVCVCVRARVYEYVGAIPYMDATFKVSRLAE